MQQWLQRLTSYVRQEFRRQPVKMALTLIGVFLVAGWWIGDISRRQQDTADLQEMEKYCSSAPDPTLDDAYYRRCMELMNN